MKHSFNNVSIILLVFSSLAGSSAAFPKSVRNAVVQGIVTDNAGNRISGAAIAFVHAGEEKVVVVGNKDGSYSAILGPGKYSVQLKFPPFCELHRSDIFVSPDANIRLDLQLNLCGIEDPVIAQDFIPSHSCRGGFCEEELDQIGPAQIRPFVIYHRREKNRLAVTYTGWRTSNVYAAPQFSFDVFTLIARTLILRPQEKTVEGVGDVQWQDGHVTWHGQRISLSLANGSITVIKRE